MNSDGAQEEKSVEENKNMPLKCDERNTEVKKKIVRFF